MTENIFIVDNLGWVATGVFIASYFFASATMLRTFQMIGAILWIAYGIVISASPVIVANALVFSAAAWTAVRATRNQVFACVTPPRDGT